MRCKAHRPEKRLVLRGGGLDGVAEERREIWAELEARLVAKKVEPAMATDALCR